MNVTVDGWGIIPCEGCNMYGEYVNQLLTEEELFNRTLFDVVRRNYCEANREYLQEQIRIASEYLDDEQKERFRLMGYVV